MTQTSLSTYFRLCTEFYDLDKPHNEQSQEFQFYLGYAQNSRGPILEPMCGSGRFLIPLLQAGFDIEGFDASPHMLDALQTRYAMIYGASRKAPVSCTFLEDFKADKRYALIFIPFGSFGLITKRSDAQKSLDVLYNHLMPGGTLVLEIETVSSFSVTSNPWRYGAHTRADGKKVVLNAHVSYNVATQLYEATCYYDLVADNVIQIRETELFKQYLYQFDEMDKLLAQFPFTHIKKFQNFEKNNAIDQQAPLLIYECTK